MYLQDLRKYVEAMRRFINRLVSGKYPVNVLTGFEEICRGHAEVVNPTLNPILLIPISGIPPI